MFQKNQSEFRPWQQQAQSNQHQHQQQQGNSRQHQHQHKYFNQRQITRNQGQSQDQKAIFINKKRKQLNFLKLKTKTIYNNSKAKKVNKNKSTNPNHNQNDRSAQAQRQRQDYNNVIQIKQPKEIKQMKKLKKLSKSQSNTSLNNKKYVDKSSNSNSNVTNLISNSFQKRYFLTEQQIINNHNGQKQIIQEIKNKKQNISKIISLRKIPFNNNNQNQNQNQNQKRKDKEKNMSNNLFLQKMVQQQNSIMLQNIKKLPIVNNFDNLNISPSNINLNINNKNKMNIFTNQQNLQKLFSTYDFNKNKPTKHFKTQSHSIQHCTPQREKQKQRQKQKTLHKKNQSFGSNSHFNLYQYYEDKNKYKLDQKKLLYQKINQKQKEIEKVSNTYNLSKRFDNGQLKNLYKTEQFVTRQDLKNHLKNVLKFEQNLNKLHATQKQQQKNKLGPSPTQEVLRWNHLNKKNINLSQSKGEYQKQIKLLNEKKEQKASFLENNKSFYLKRTALGKTFHKTKTPLIQPKSFLLPKIQVCDWQT